MISRYSLMPFGSVGICDLTPWIIHNMILHDHIIPHSTQGGHLLLVSNGMLDHPDVKAGKYTKDILKIPELINQDQLNAYEYDVLKRQIALDLIKNNITNI